MQITTLRSLIALGALAAFAVAPLRFSEEKLRDSDHKKFGKAIAAYYDAKDRKKGIENAFLKVSKDMDKAQKKLKAVPLLSAVQDWERALWYAQRATLKGRPKGGRVISGSLEKYGEIVPTAYHLPPKYTSKKNPYPLVLCVPDAGQKPGAHIEDHWNDVALRGGAIFVAVDMPTETAGWDKFTTDPGSGVWAVMNTYAVAKVNFAIDMNRVFLAGTGKGFLAAAATASSFPHLFAGVIGKGEIPMMSATNFRNIPSLLMSESEGAQAFESAVGEMGFENCVRKADGGPADVLSFVGEKLRVNYPAEITFAPYCDLSRNTQWVTVEGFQVDQEKATDEQPWINAKADRASNTVTIEAKEILKITVLLNDSLVDLEKPVTFLINGKESQEMVPRNKRFMLDYAFSSGDWGRVFTSKLERETE